MMERTTVICAVYSNDPNRFSLIEGHLFNLKKQTVQVRPIYIFENSDHPPTSINLSDAEIIVYNKPLTIYEAWNIGLAAVRSELVMNLNLDDRLHFDAIERLEQELTNKQGDLIGGDWKICYSQPETDQVNICFENRLIPFTQKWPPDKGTLTRLGSGDGSRGTYGPATLWKLSAHLTFPRYPYRTFKNQKIKSVADSIWWDILKNHLGKQLIRFPFIVGNYHSHPSEQAEFRVGDEWVSLNGQKILSL